MPRKSKQPNTITMVVTVPRVGELTPAEHRKAVREAIGAAGDFHGRRISVRGYIKPTGGLES